MDWLLKNWVWIVVALGVFLMLRHHGGSGRIGGGLHHGEANGGSGAGRDRQERLNDPVSGEPVDPAIAINSTYRGHTYYFGSRENRDKFEAAPAQYAAAPGIAGDTHRHRRHGC